MRFRHDCDCYCHRREKTPTEKRADAKWELDRAMWNMEIAQKDLQRALAEYLALVV